MVYNEAEAHLAAEATGTMEGRQAKYCLDENHIKWSLVEGVITRKGAQDGPHDGQTLPVSEIKAIERTEVRHTHRSSLGWPVTLAGVLFLGLSIGLATWSWLAAAPVLVLGLLLLIWGIKRIPARTEIRGGFRFVAPVANPDAWVMAGDVPEVRGFIDGVKAEMAWQSQREQEPSKP